MATFTTLTHYNYHDRIISIIDAPTSSRLNPNPLITTDVSFNPGDGIYTKQIVNQFKNNHNYAIVTEFTSETDYTYTRWFIIEAKRLRTGQYELTLKRDVIADYYEDVINSTFLIEKGIPQVDSPLTFNRESVSFNQIKMQDDIELKDTSGVQWIYAYIPKNTVIEDTINVPSSSNNEEEAIYIGNDINKWKYNTSSFITYDKNMQWIIRGVRTGVASSSGNRLFRFSSLNGQYNDDIHSQDLSSLTLTTSYDAWRFTLYRESQKASYISLGGKDTFINALKEILPNYHDNEETEDYLSYDGKIVRDSSNYYKVKIAEVGNQGDGDIKSGTTLFALMSSFASRVGFDGTPNNNSFEWDMNTKIYQTILIPIARKATSFKLSGSRNACADALYDIVAFPYDNGIGGTLGGYLSDSINFMCQGDVQRNGATALGTKLSGQLYDIQFLPYAPFSSNLFKKYGSATYIDLSKLQENKDYTIIKDGDGNSLGLLFYLSTSNYNFTINEKISLTETIITTTTTTSLSSRFVVTQSQSSPVNIASFDLGDYENVKNVIINSVIRTTADTDIDVTDDCVILGVQGKYNVNYLQDVIYSTTTITFVVTISFDHDITETTEDIDTREKQLIYKISNECDLYRLVSPNYTSTFEFSPSKNDGVDHFDVKMTLRPINPYIHIKPHFKSFYGFNPQYDGRGLVLSGDYSFGQLQDNFITYELNNKNYQEIFNRQIEKMDFDNKMGKVEAVTNATAGVISSAGQGAAMGAFVGGGFGAAIGGVAAGVSSAIGGIADIAVYDKKAIENRRFAQDIYNYQLGNIKALPYTLARTNAQNVNYHIFPFIEVFTATDEEKEILKNKLKYDGWTLMTIDTLKNYLSDTDKVYIKGQLIRSYRNVTTKPSVIYNGLFGDDNIIKEIAIEISKGVYM